jgi:hypothetical protein
MNEAKLAAIFRGVVLATLPAALGAASAGCGGQVESGGVGTGGGPDGGVASCPRDDGGAHVCVASWDVPTPASCVGLGDTSFDGGWVALSSADCVEICGPARPNCGAYQSDGGIYVECPPMCTGRRPPGLLESDDTERGIGAWFARSARLEAASVFAFRTLAQELSSHGAPKRLLAATERAERDEVRHARMMGALARRFGAKPLAAHVTPGPVRPLDEVALENAVEGCVRETFGALIAFWQAAAAHDPAIRKAMRIIARDETRHAALAWRVARWAEPRSGHSARRRIAEARRAALRELERETQLPVPSELTTLGGMPDAAQSRELFARLSAVLWHEA